MAELSAIDPAHRPQPRRVLAPDGVRNYRYGYRPRGPRQLDGLTAYTTRAAPDQHHITIPDGVTPPAMQHPVSRGAHQRGRGRLRP